MSAIFSFHNAFCQQTLTSPVTRQESVKSLSLSNKALNDNNDDEDDGKDGVFMSDVVAKVPDGCQIQLIISYHRTQQTLTVNIVKLFGINALTNRNYSYNSDGTTYGTTSLATFGTTRPSFRAVVAAAVAAKNANDLTNTTRNCHSREKAYAQLYVGLTVLPDRDKCLVTTAKTITDDVIVWNESFNFGGK